jgi:hypothetical protein
MPSGYLLDWGRLKDPRAQLYYWRMESSIRLHAQKLALLRLVNISPTPLLLMFDALSTCNTHRSMVEFESTIIHSTSCWDNLMSEHFMIKSARAYPLIGCLGRY